MASASGGLLFVNGLGAITGPILVGWFMSVMGPGGYWAYLTGIMLVMACYVAYRMTQRVSLYADEDDYEPVAYAPVQPTGTGVSVEAAAEYYAENADNDEQVENKSDNPLD